MNKFKSVVENEMYKILWDFEIQTNHIILIKRLGLINKKKEYAIKWISIISVRMKR